MVELASLPVASWVPAAMVIVASLIVVVATTVLASKND
jgi:hypothetical protein